MISQKSIHDLRTQLVRLEAVLDCLIFDDEEASVAAILDEIEQLKKLILSVFPG